MEAVRLSDRYITDRFMPDKAIDVIDETGSRAKMKSYALPEELKALEQEQKRVTRDKELAVTLQNFEEAVKLREEEERHKRLLEEAKREWKKNQEKNRPVITKEEVGYVVSKMTGIPLYKLEEVESQKLLHMEEELHKRIVGQEEAIEAICRAIRRSRAGLKETKRPIGSFIFLGPTGVGKTELCRALAEFLFDNEQAMIRLDMSEFMEKHSVARLIGAPPGYVGYEEGGQLTEAVRRKPYSVVLFDEIEKAHPDVFNALLQILEDGRMTDGQGRTVDFKNTVIIMTSNLGSQHIQELGEKQRKEMEHQVMAALRQAFKPEFLNRIDETVIFNSLGREQIKAIVEIQLGRLGRMLADRKLKLEVSDKAKALLAEKGYDPAYGARPLKRTIQRWIQDPLATKILAGEFREGERVKVDSDGKNVTFARGGPADGEEAWAGVLH